MRAKPIGDFFKGLRFEHVDYATRHYSRAYKIGTNTGGILFLLLLASPIVLTSFVLGVAACVHWR